MTTQIQLIQFSDSHTGNSLEHLLIVDGEQLQENRKLVALKYNLPIEQVLFKVKEVVNITQNPPSISGTRI